MIEQLNELLDMQAELDKRILGDDPYDYKTYPITKMRIALFVELGELMNELPTYFKHWKKSAVNNREKALVEYVDCLHFVLSMMNSRGSRATRGMHLYSFFPKDNYDISGAYLIKMLSDLASRCEVNYLLSTLFDLGCALGFTWEEIYQTYIEKNAINFQRQEGGY